MSAQAKPIPNTAGNVARKFLLAMDGGQHSQRALTWYARHFNSPQDELIFAYIADPPSSGNGFDVITPDKMSPRMDAVIAMAKSMAATAARSCTQLGVVSRIRFLERVSHDVGQAIIDLAAEESVDIIIIGNRGSGGVKRALLGSVSDFVLRHSHRTTIIVPPPKAGR